MRVVSNTSPILNLAIIGRLPLLLEQFGEVHIPRAVLEELRPTESLPGAGEVRKAVSDGWIQVMEVDDSALLRVLIRGLDRGEAEAIVLAVREEADLVLIDEREGRRVARELGLKVTGVLGILLKAHREGRLDAFEAVVEDLERVAGFWIAPELRTQLLVAADNNCYDKPGSEP